MNWNGIGNGNWRIPRRTVLRGAGAVLALPLLDAMQPLAGGDAAAQAQKAAAGSAATPASPVRMAFLYMPNGVNSNAWACQGNGQNFQLGEALKPLEALKQDVLCFSELWNANTNTGDGHYFKTAAWLTGTTITRTTGSDLRSGSISVDQLVAQKIGLETPLPSLELGTEPVRTGVDANVGITQLYGGHISWSTPTTPVAKEINPRLAFDRLFRTKARGKQHHATDDRSVLDAVLDDTQVLRTRVGHADRLKLDEYLDSVRAVEKRIAFETKRRTDEAKMDPLARKEIESLDKRINDVFSNPGKINDRKGNHTEQVRLMLDIIALAFWTDSTRVATFMFGNAVSGRNFSFIDGVSGGHHQISHHEGDKAKLAEYAKINAWHAEQYAYLLQKLKSIKEGEKNLLDNSMIVFGSGLRDGNSHSPRNLPMILAGRGGGTISTGRHVKYGKDSPLCNLYVSMLNRMGVPTTRFGDSTGELKGLNDPNFGGA